MTKTEALGLPSNRFDELAIAMAHQPCCALDAKNRETKVCASIKAAAATQRQDLVSQ
jgi:hypothetical protein